MGALIDLLQQIIALLDDIKTNTTPADSQNDELTQ